MRATARYLPTRESGWRATPRRLKTSDRRWVPPQDQRGYGMTNASTRLSRPRRGTATDPGRLASSSRTSRSALLEAEQGDQTLRLAGRRGPGRATEDPLAVAGHECLAGNRTPKRVQGVRGSSGPPGARPSAGTGPWQPHSPASAACRPRPSGANAWIRLASSPCRRPDPEADQHHVAADDQDLAEVEVAVQARLHRLRPGAPARAVGPTSRPPWPAPRPPRQAPLATAHRGRSPSSCSVAVAFLGHGPGPGRRLAGAIGSGSKAGSPTRRGEGACNSAVRRPRVVISRQ